MFQSHSIRFSCLLFVAFLVTGCVSDNGFSEEQQAVYNAMTKWTRACEQRDTDALWEMRSPDAQRYYARELKERVIPTVRMQKAALAPDSMISDERRKEIEAHLKKLPPDAESMTPQQYHAWVVEKELTPDNIANQIRLFSRENIAEIKIDVDRATVELHNGETRRYSWRRESGDWKFDVTPSILRDMDGWKE